MSSWFKYISLFFLLGSMARRIGNWYREATDGASDGGEDITMMEWTMLMDVFIQSIAEAFNMDPGDVKGNLKNVMED